MEGHPLAAAVGEQIYLAANNARGAIWEAMSTVPTQLWLLYGLVARLRGRHAYGAR